MKSGHLGVLILAGIVSACGSSPPTHFYTLSTQPAPNTAGQLGYPMRTVALGEVKLPDALDRPQIARQIGPNQLEFAETDRWAGPLDDMTRRVLAADLRPLLPAGTALVTNDSSTPAQTTVAVEVSRFDADKSGRVTLDANWETLDKNAKVVGAPRQAKNRRARFGFRFCCSRGDDEPGRRRSCRQHRRRIGRRQHRIDALITPRAAA